MQHNTRNLRCVFYHPASMVGDGQNEVGRTVFLRPRGESLTDMDPNTPAHRRTSTRRARIIKLLFHNGVRAAKCAAPPGLELRAVSGENMCNESLFSSLLETIAKPLFAFLLAAQLMGDSFYGRDKAVQFYLVDKRDVDRVKKLIAGIKE